MTNVVAVQAGADRTNLPEPVDLILMVDTYHHIPKRVAYFSALKTVMKPGARLKSAPSCRSGFSLETTHDFLPRQIFLVYRAN